MTESRWSDDSFLDSLRRQTDPLADSTVAALERDHGIEAVNRIFATLHADDRAVPADAPAPFRAFVAATRSPLPGLDQGRLTAAARSSCYGFSAPRCCSCRAAGGYSAPA
jgi:hypothetical protein